MFALRASDEVMRASRVMHGPAGHVLVEARGVEPLSENLSAGRTENPSGRHPVSEPTAFPRRRRCVFHTPPAVLLNERSVPSRCPQGSASQREARHHRPKAGITRLLWSRTSLTLRLCSPAPYSASSCRCIPVRRRPVCRRRAGSPGSRGVLKALRYTSPSPPPQWSGWWP